MADDLNFKREGRIGVLPQVQQAFRHAELVESKKIQRYRTTDYLNPPEKELKDSKYF
jgi:hypothetical protein